MQSLGVFNYILLFNYIWNSANKFVFISFGISDWSWSPCLRLFLIKFSLNFHPFEFNCWCISPTSSDVLCNFSGYIWISAFFICDDFFRVKSDTIKLNCSIETMLSPLLYFIFIMNPDVLRSAYFVP